MADPLAALPADDESPQVLLEDAIEYMRANVPDWEPSPGSPDYGLLAAGADEDAVQYALLRERADDWACDLGAAYGVPDPQPTPAVTTTTWTARPGRSGVLTAGSTLVIDAPQGLIAFEVVESVPVGVGATVAGVSVQAMDAGTEANGATGPVLLDQAPSWVATVTVDAPALGGADAAGDEEHLAQIRRAARLAHRAVVHADDLEIAILDVPTVARAMVRDNFDVDTGDDDVEGICTVFPLDADGETIDEVAILDQIEELVTGVGRRILNGIMKFGAATYTEIDVDVTVIPVDGHDAAAVEDGVIAAIGQALSPALWGQPALGEVRRWRMRRIVRRYEVAAAVDLVDGVDQVAELTLTTGGPGAVNADGDVELDGHAPLPRPGTPTVTFADPA